ncbi:MAG: hypothetical protein IT476_01450 [Rhodanobacteraceae bacterium]|nr:hypothetical protein [Rhodanobacteraceae bacterium]
MGNQVAGGYVDFDAADGNYSLNHEQRLCLADPAGPVDLSGVYFIVEDTFHSPDCTTETPFNIVLEARP